MTEAQERAIRKQVIRGREMNIPLAEDLNLLLAEIDAQRELLQDALHALQTEDDELASSVATKIREALKGKR